MRPDRQNQHKIPRVYLKKFGYRNRNNQWMLSVMARGEQSARQKSIGSFTPVPNIFDIDSEDPRIQRMFEEINGNLESSYNIILNDLQETGALSERSFAYLLQLIANLIVRDDVWREQVRFLLDSDVKANFLKSILGHHCRNEEEFGRIEELDFYRNLADLPTQEALSRVLLCFIDHLLLRLRHFEIVFLRTTPEKPWFTSTSPVVVHSRTAPFELFAVETEIYFPLSPDFLTYGHFPGSADQNNVYRGYASNQIHQLNDEQITTINQLIVENASDFLIFRGETHQDLDA
jgi:hypothetical protein